MTTEKRDGARHARLDGILGMMAYVCEVRPEDLWQHYLVDYLSHV